MVPPAEFDVFDSVVFVVVVEAATTGFDFVDVVARVEPAVVADFFGVIFDAVPLVFGVTGVA